MNPSIRRLALTSLASLVLGSSSAGTVADAQSPLAPAPQTDALSVAAGLVDMLGYALRHVGDRPWVSPDDPNAVPLNLIPPLSIATKTKARSYSDGCHALPKVRKATGCDYGVLTSPTTVVILGDSHGSMYLPALELIAARRGWKLHLLTKSACPPADVTVSFLGKRYDACDQWRAGAFKVIKRLQPDMVIVTSAADYRLAAMPGDLTSKRYLKAWRTGLTATLRTLGRAAGKVVLLGDVAKFQRPAVSCLTKHLDDVTACATARATAIRPAMTATYRQAARKAGATYVDPSVLTCPGDPCTVVSGRDLIAYDRSHLTPVWSRLINRQLEALLPDPAR